MTERHRSDSRTPHPLADSDTGELVSQEAGLTQTFHTGTRERASQEAGVSDAEADIILIAHPDSQRLGSRFRLSPGSTLEIGLDRKSVV